MKLPLAIKIAGIFCAIALTLFQCTHSIAGSGGGSTTTDNASVSGQAFYMTGLPAKGAFVRIRPFDYVRAIGLEPDSITRHDTTVSDSGWYHINSLKTGEYRIEINDNTTSASLVKCSILTPKDSLVLPADTLASYQTVLGKVDSTLLGKAPLYVQVFGMDRITTVDSATGAFVFAAMPQGTYRLRVISSDTTITPVIIDTAKTDTTNVSPVAGQWVQTNGPFVATVKCIAVSASGDVYAGTNGGGVYRSADNGTTWAVCNTGLTNLTIQCLAASPDGAYAYAGTAQGIFLTADKGATWTAVYSTLPTLAQDVRCLVACADGAGGTALYIGTKGHGIFKSTTNGAVWSVILAGNGLSDTTNILSLGAIPNGAGGSIVFAGTWSEGVFRTVNNGAAWTKLNNGLTDLTIESFGASPNGAIVYLGNGQGVASSADTGATWTVHSIPGMFGFVNSLATIAGGAGMTLLAGDYGGGMSASTDSGATWTAVASGLSGEYVNALAVKGVTLLAGVDYDGMFVSTDNGLTWTVSNNGLTNVNVVALVSVGTDLYAGTGLGVYSSPDNGVTWKAANSGLTSMVLEALGAAPNQTGGTNLYAAPSSGMFLSSDNGASWSALTSAPAGISVKSFASLGTTVFAGADKGGANTVFGIYMTNDNGATWSPVGSGSGIDTEGINAFALAPAAAGGQTMFAGTGGGGVFRSSNNGLSWSAVNNGLVAVVPPYAQSQANIVLSLAVSTTSGGSTEIIAGTEEGLFISANNGDSWTVANNGLGTYPLVTALAVAANGSGGNNFFAALGGGPLFNGVFVSTNNGATWKSVTAGLPNTWVNALCVRGNVLFAGTDGSGVWKLQLK
jgi:hypothetical protein